MTQHLSIEQLNIEEGYGLLTKSNYETQLHRHYAIEIIYCREGVFDVQTKHAHCTNIKTILIPSNLPHRFRCSDAECKLLFIDPLSSLGRFVSNQYQLEKKQDPIVDPQQLEFVLDKSFLSNPHTKQINKEPKQAVIDPRIEHCMETIRGSLCGADLTIEQLGRICFLSESRLSHMFKDQTGVSIRQYILWKKMCLAISKVFTGQSLTASAHDAGFFDSAHFYKVFSNMFGVNPFLALKK